MKILIVSSGNSGNLTPFVKEQGDSLSNLGIEVHYFLIKGKGALGYLKNLPLLRKEIQNISPEIVHAHYGLSGFLASMQRLKPVVVTFHGCDINDSKTRLLGKVTFHSSRYSIFVNSEMPGMIKAKNKFKIIPCGTDLAVFRPLDKKECRQILGFDFNAKIALFSSGFDVPVKNYPLAFESCKKIKDLTLVELKNCSRDKVNLLLNACDLLLLTSIREGSPQIIKEALATNCPIVSTDVGDVRARIENIKGCYVVSNSENEIAEKIKHVLGINSRTKGRIRIEESKLDLHSIAEQVAGVYKSILR